MRTAKALIPARRRRSAPPTDARAETARPESAEQHFPVFVMPGILQRPPVPAAQRSFARHEVPAATTTERGPAAPRNGRSSVRMMQQEDDVKSRSCGDAHR